MQLDHAEIIQQRKKQHLHSDRQHISFEARRVSPAQEIAETRVHSQLAAMGGETESEADGQAEEEIDERCRHVISF